MRCRAIAAGLLVCVLPILAFAKDGGRRRKSESLPASLEVLRQAMEPAALSYEGLVSVDGKPMRVRFDPPGRYRRETLDAEGRPALIVVSDGKTEWIYDKAGKRAWQGEPADPAAKRLGPDDEYVLLKANFEVSVADGGRVARRRVWLLELRSRHDGLLQRRLWVDRKTGLILKSQNLSEGAASAIEFKTVFYPKKPQKDRFFEFSPPRGAAVVKRAEPDFKALGEAKSASGLEPRTPLWLPSGYVFESLDVLARGAGKVIHYRYSDGMNVLSLFQGPARLKPDFGNSSTRSVKLAAGSGSLARTREGNVLGWSSGRSQFVLVGPVPAESLQRVAQSIR
ncbi:MAG: hypothetical protein HY077_08380 [Elusimicrobia bacterium]|nr:hypothetical protein [Elusimicrobiota bacterium]